jgi:hypothetical protein
MRHSALTVLILTPLLARSAPGADAKFKLEPLKEAAPAEVAEKLRSALSAEGVRVLDDKGEPHLDLWLRKEVHTVADKGELGVKLGILEEGTFIGVVRAHKKATDFRGQNYAPGVYTCRYCLQPRDGDHLGVSESRDFLLLVQAKSDTSPEPLAAKEIVKLSAEVSGKKHPAVLYVLRSAGGDGKLPRLAADEDLGYWMVECELPGEAGGKEPARLKIVFVGKAPDV